MYTHFFELGHYQYLFLSPKNRRKTFIYYKNKRNKAYEMILKIWSSISSVLWSLYYHPFFFSQKEFILPDNIFLVSDAKSLLINMWWNVFSIKFSIDLKWRRQIFEIFKKYYYVKNYFIHWWFFFDFNASY